MRFIIRFAVLGLALSAVAAPVRAQGYGQAVLVADDHLFVGESLYETRAGRVYVYQRDGGTWREIARLEASDAAPNDHFGRALALAEGDLLVGATIARESGALYVFRRGADGRWQESAVLTPSDARPEHSFGRMAATDGRVVLMADWAADESSGAVYVFEKQGGTWRETAKLKASDAQAGDWFGGSVAIANGRILVGARNRGEGRGGAYVFERAAAGWTEVARIEPPVSSPNLQFGTSAAIVDGDLLIGAPGADGFVGAAFVYRRGASGWTAEGKITPPAGTGPSNAFPGAIAASGREAWIGAPAIEAGRLLRFTKAADGTWTRTGEPIVGRTLEAGDGLGGSVSVAGTVAAAGAIGDDFGYGSVVVFERSGDAWPEAALLSTEVEALDPIVDTRVECQGGQARIFACNGVDVLAFLPVQQIGAGRGAEVNDVWGWIDPVTGKEWALVGRFDGTSFIDISNPLRPVYVGDLPKHEGSRANTWRDIKVYRDHAFIVADGAGPHGMQVFDLTRLRDVPVAAVPATFTEDAHYDRIASAHNIVINEQTGFAYAVGASSGGETCGGGLHMIDIREPKAPAFAGCFQDTQTGNQRTGYTHDAQCVIYRGPDSRYRGREICFGSNETALSIADVTKKDSTIAISRAAYPNVGYAHQGWLDEQHEYFYMNDEGDETSGTVQNTRTLVWDVKDLEDPVIAMEYFGPSTASDHNLYIVGDLMYQSNYVSGLRIVDISERTAPREVGFFDTVPWNESPGFDGSWSNYPFFPSGTIVVTSGKEGVFLVRRATRPIS